MRGENIYIFGSNWFGRINLTKIQQSSMLARTILVLYLGFKPAAIVKR